GKLLKGLMVNGNPAFAVANYSTNVFYLRSDDTNGSSWGSLSKVFSTTNGINGMALAMVAGRPAIAVCANQRIYFARANDANGASWPAFTLAVQPDTTNDMPVGNLSLLDISSKPVIGFIGQVGMNSLIDNIFLAQSTDGNGTSWNLPQSCATASASSTIPSFNVVGGVLDVAYARDEVLHFSKSSFSGGFYFFTAQYDIEPAEGTCSLETVDGQTAIAF